MTEALRAKDILDDAAALGAELADLILAAVAARSAVPSVADYVAVIAPTFGPGTAATYGPYWRLTIAHPGDRRLSDVSVVDLQTVVADAALRANAPGRPRLAAHRGKPASERYRPCSPGPAPPASSAPIPQHCSPSPAVLGAGAGGRMLQSCVAVAHC